MTGAESLSRRLEKYVTGSYAGFLNNPTNVEIKNKFGRLQHQGHGRGAKADGNVYNFAFHLEFSPFGN